MPERRIPTTPRETPKPWIIDKIKDGNKEKEQEDDREQPTVEIIDDYEKPTEIIEEPKQRRGSVEIDDGFFKDTKV